MQYFHKVMDWVFATWFPHCVITPPKRKGSEPKPFVRCKYWGVEEEITRRAEAIFKHRFDYRPRRIWSLKFFAHLLCI